MSDEPVEFIESVLVPAAHVEVEADGGIVALNVDSPEHGIDFTLLMSPTEARTLGDMLFRLGCS